MGFLPFSASLPLDAYLDHLLNKTLILKDLLQGLLLGKLRWGNGWEGEELALQEQGCDPSCGDLSTRQGSKVWIWFVEWGRSPSSFPKDGEDDGDKGGNSGRYHGASSRHCSHIDELIQSSEQPCAVGSIIAPLYRGGDWGTQRLSGLPRGGGAVGWQTQAFISLVTSCIKDSERPCGRESSSLQLFSNMCDQESSAWSTFLDPATASVHAV